MDNENPGETIGRTSPLDRTSLTGIFTIFLRLGLTSFGGPVAHLGYLHDEFVGRRKWLSENAYADLVALCQFLPGPASSQVGIAIGLSRREIPGAIAAWLGFTLPSAMLLALFGLGVENFGDALAGGWLHGLKVVAVAVVAQALWGMGKTLCPDRMRATFAIIAAIVTVTFPSAMGQIAAIVFGGILGWLMFRKEARLPHTPLNITISPFAGMVSLGLLFFLLFFLSFFANSPEHPLYVFGGFFRAGALVFGGGHVVLPLLQSVVVPTGLVSNDTFLAGYGAAQAVPGPLFTLAAYLGAVMDTQLRGWAGASICLVAIFLPAFLFVVGVLPFWERLRSHHTIQSSMQGINAAVVGILLSAFYDPVWTSAIFNPADFVMMATAFLTLVFWKWPPWLVVILSAAAGSLIY